MEAQEEVMGSNQISKGKRTKRQRYASPLGLTMASSSSSTAEGSGSGGGGGGGLSDNSGGFNRMTASPTNSAEFIESTVEEEDMANCLILLARGKTRNLSDSAVVAAANKAGLCVYECKTCNRCFPSFQALGGHRASHKRPKAATVEEKKAVSSTEVEDDHRLTNNCTTLSLQISNRSALCSTNNKSKVHECSICGAEFTSGQALGGHMRRHRTMPMATTGPDHKSQDAKKPRNLLSLDLNLPAPEDDHREPKFPFASKEQVIVFSTSPLVDCHY